MAFVVAEFDWCQSDLVATKSEHVWLIVHLIISDILQTLDDRMTIITLYVLQNPPHDIELSFRFDKFGSIQLQETVR